MKKGLISALACGLIALLPGCSCDMAKKEAPKTEVPTPVEAPVTEAPKQDNAKMTQSGVKVEVLEATKVADAKKAQAGQKVTVHYTGFLAKEDGAQGDKFDSSFDHGSSFSFVLGAGQVIKGWDEGVAELAVGDKARLTVPAQLAYGEKGVPGAIPANANLIFDVELLEVA
jgi:FKBP-type peptidyl-prolyl cis-trans isomerase